MSGYRDLAVSSMRAVTMTAHDFMNDPRANLPLPMPTPAELESIGALPAMVREPASARELLLPADLVILFGLGDFNAAYDCSSYFDPKSAWYNVFFGAYALLSHKPDGMPWGYHKAGEPFVDEFLRVPQIDYNFFAAATLGCPPNAMCFDYQPPQLSATRGWDVVDTAVTIPSGLYDPRIPGAAPSSCVPYGVPDPAFVDAGTKPYEHVPMQGRFLMKAVTTGIGPITFAWGTLCPATTDGAALLGKIMALLGKYYMNWPSP